MSTLKLEELDVPDTIIKELHKSNITEVTDLQQNIISNVKNGRSLVVKPADEKEKINAIVITVLDLAHQHENDKETNCLILAPSPDRVQAIHKQISELETSDLSFISIDETGNESWQGKFLSDKPAILIATPHQLQKVLREQRHIFRHVYYIAVDGLDEMDSPEQRFCLKQIRLRIFSDYTSLIFASSLETSIKETSTSFNKDPVIIGFPEIMNGQMKSPPALSKSLKQSYIEVPPRMKISTLMALIGKSTDGKNVIFTASKRGTDRLYKILKKQNIQSVSLHGRLTEGKKARRFEQFASGRVSYLLVADISAAELELNNMTRVINYDVPNNTDEYRHRAALLEAGESASIISLVSGQDRSDIRELQNELKSRLEKQALPRSIQKKAENHKKSLWKESSGRKKIIWSYHVPAMINLAVAETGIMMRSKAFL